MSDFREGGIFSHRANIQLFLWVNISRCNLPRTSKTTHNILMYGNLPTPTIKEMKINYLKKILPLQ